MKKDKEGDGEDGEEDECEESDNIDDVGVSKDGELECKETFWFVNGRIKRSIQSTSSTAEGECKRRHEDGQKSYVTNYKDGNLVDGKKTEWYENGQIKTEANYKDGKLEGKSTAWLEDGQIKTEANYKDGD